MTEFIVRATWTQLFLPNLWLEQLLLVVNIPVFIVLFVSPIRYEERIVPAKYFGLILKVLLKELLPKFLLGLLQGNHRVIARAKFRELFQ